MTELDRLCVNTLRFLAVDAVEAANSGHPGLPLGAAPIAHALWDRCLRHNPANPKWFNRDRFILSAGHGSALLYALLHTHGYDLPLEEIKSFRQWGSKTPGHPEYGLTPGVEATTGPLGQGFTMGVGMAMAEKFLAGQFNRAGFPVVDHYTFAIVSDGDLMEGISYEAASLAGFLRLGKLIYLYDDNDISIDGSTDITFKDDVPRRFEAAGWHVLSVADANDLDAIEQALQTAREETGKPSIIIVRSHIGYGSPKQDQAAVHGAPLGQDGTRATKENLDWPLEPAFHVPEEVTAHFRERRERSAQQEQEWNDLFDAYQAKHPQPATELKRMLEGKPADGWEAALPQFCSGDKKMATREAGGKVMNLLAEQLPGLIGGAADLASSTKTRLTEFADLGSAEENARNIHFGIREHAMGAIVNGMALHGGVIPYGSTFLIFSDYMRPSLRLAALMQTHSIFVFTHDSVALGEDGPTHQPVEHLACLRAIPGLTVLRPADPNETAAAWRVAIERNGPTALALSRQKVPTLGFEAGGAYEGVRRGGYVLAEAAGGAPQVVLIGTGAEVHLVLAARAKLAEHRMRARVVSMPSCELFDEQPTDYRQEILPPGVPRISVEAGSPMGWREYVGDSGAVIGIERFGASAPGGTVLDKFGFSVENIVSRALALVKK